MEDKMVYLSEKYCVISRSPASRANDIIKWEPEHFVHPRNQHNREHKLLNLIEGLNRNASIKVVGKDKAFLMAERNIKANEEIYIDYGFEYWQFFFLKHQ
jgi:3-methyladenine DNA glycosylase AlkC